MKKEMLAIGMLSGLLVSFQASAKVKANSSFICKADGGAITDFNFDLYLTDHPMGGMHAFSGMFEAKGQLVCNQTIGTISISKAENDHWTYSGESYCLRRAEFELEIDYSSKTIGSGYPAVLKYRAFDPFGPQPYQSQKMNCKFEVEEGKQE